MSVNRFRPSGWSTLGREKSPSEPVSDAPSIADIVTGRAREGGGAGAAARSLAATGGRKAVAAFLTPAGEKVLHRIGYRRVLTAVVAMAATAALGLGMLIAAAMSTAPATAPAAIAGNVLSDAVDLFGGGDGSKDQLSGEQLAAAGRSAAISCPVRSSAASTTTSTAVRPATPVTTSPASGSAAATTSAGRAVNPVRVGADGSISRSDARALIEPVLPGTSALTANVWFMYRMAGLGDWDAFTAAYKAAKLSGEDKSAGAVLQQVQTLNPVGVAMEPYRFTAAALTSAGQVTGRLKDPYPEFRQVVAAELVSGCMDNADAAAQRVSLPPPSTVTTTAPAPATRTAPGR